MDKVADNTAQQLWALHREATQILDERLTKRGADKTALVVNESVAQRPCRQRVDLARHSARNFPVFFQLLPIFGARATVFWPAGT